MSKWEEKRLRDLCSDISYGYTESATYTEIGPKFLRITDITSDYINWETVPFCKISEQDFEKYKLQYNDIVIARTGATSGYNQQFRENIDAVYASYLIRFRIDESKANPRFVYYYLQSSAYKGFINNYISGAAQPGINATVLSKLKIPLPDEKTQKHIAIVLSVYDDLIEANNRRIELLEQTAKELYKEWFVRFRFPGYENAKFENGLPERWELKKIGDIARVKSGYAFKSEWWIDEGVPVVKIKDIQGNTIDFGDLSHVSEDHAEIAKQFYIVEGDLLIAMTGATIGKMALVPYSEKQMVVNQRVGKFFLGESPSEKVAFLYMTLQQNWVQELIVMIAGSNAAQPNISPFDIEKIKVVYNEDMVDEYNRRSAPFIEEILQLRKQNQNLATQRDMLLPRLMSGKLEVN